MYTFINVLCTQNNLGQHQLIIFDKLQVKAPERARAIFSDLDFDGDGMITEEEFVTGSGESVKSKLVVKCVQGAWRTVSSWQLFTEILFKKKMTNIKE